MIVEAVLIAAHRREWPLQLVAQKLHHPSSEAESIIFSFTLYMVLPSRRLHRSKNPDLSSILIKAWFVVTVDLVCHIGINMRIQYMDHSDLAPSNICHAE
jgi:hypothetical protein